MPNIDSVFNFQGQQFVVKREDFAAHIPSSIKSRESLFIALASELNFPDYFGKNWDSLSECLCDLSWIQTRRVVIVHSEVLPLEKINLSTYLDILAECVEHWKSEEEHQLIVVFPPDCHDKIQKMALKIFND